MSRKLDDLHPDVAAAARRALARLKVEGVEVCVTDTLRTEAEQLALYAQGRQGLAEINDLRARAGMRPIGEAEARQIVTKLDGKPVPLGKGRSVHQFGRALDVVPFDHGRAIWPAPSDPRWKPIAAAFEAEGFEWGGRWADFPDYPHYQQGA